VSSTSSIGASSSASATEKRPTVKWPSAPSTAVAAEDLAHAGALEGELDELLGGVGGGGERHHVAQRRRRAPAAARSVRAGASRTIVVRLDRRVRRQLLAAMRKAGVRRLGATLVTAVRDADGRRTVSKASS